MIFAFDVFSRLPTDIQAEAIPLILGGGDVLMVLNIDSLLTLLKFSYYHFKQRCSKPTF